MKSSSHAALILVLIMLLLVLGALFWFLFRDYDTARQQAALAASRATRVTALEKEAGRIQDEANQISATRATLLSEMATAVFNQDLLAQEAVADQQTIQLLETRVATQTAVIDQNLITLAESVPLVQILKPAEAEVVFLADGTDLVVSAIDVTGLTSVSLVFSGNPPLEIPANGETSILIEESWPLSEAGSYTAVVTAINSHNISSQAISVTITVTDVRSQQQIADEVARIIGPPQPETAVTANAAQAAPLNETEAITPLILQAFNFQTDSPPDTAWGMYCDPGVIQPSSFLTATEMIESPAQELAAVQTLTRQWQESRFQLSQRLANAPHDDARAALCALAAGHESWALTEYIRRAPAERQPLLSETLTPADSLVRDDALNSQLNLGAAFGPAFVTFLAETDGPTAVLNAWENPPQTTAHILHPEQYQAGVVMPVMTLPDLTEALGDDWTLVEENVLGEFMLRQYLQNGGAGEGVETAVTGWRGDRYAIYQQTEGGPPLLVFTINWLTDQDALEFAAAYEIWLNGRFSNAVILEDSPLNTTCWATPTGETFCLLTNEATTTLINAPTTALALIAVNSLQ